MPVSSLLATEMPSVPVIEEETAPEPHQMQAFPYVKLRMLDKITARTMTFDMQVGSTVKFGDIYVKAQTCQEPPPIEKPESAAFLQIWEDIPDGDAKWVFSGWMFASSPALSSMDHPIYDVWVLDCLSNEKVPQNTKAETETETEKEEESDFELP